MGRNSLFNECSLGINHTPENILDTVLVSGYKIVNKADVHGHPLLYNNFLPSKKNQLNK
jgi:hypothetical protein